MRGPNVSSFLRRMIDLPPSVRRTIQDRFKGLERRIVTAADDEPLVAEMLYKEWLNGMEAALREAEAAESQGPAR